MYKVLLCGIEPDSGNRGCRALSWSLADLISEQRPDALISYVATRPPETSQEPLRPVPYLKTRTSSRLLLPVVLGYHLLNALVYRAIPIRAFRKIVISRDSFVRAIVESDLVGDIRLGDSFSDVYGLPRLLYGSFPLILTIIVGKRPVLLPQTYGPYKSPLARLLARFIMRRSKLICARDIESLALADRLLGKSRGRVKSVLCPDVAFTLKAEAPKSSRIDPDLSPSAVVVGLNVSTLLYSGNYGKRHSFGVQVDCAKWVNSLVDRLLTDDSLHVLLVPHVLGSGVDDDLSVCKTMMQDLQSRYNGRIHLLEGDYSQSEVKGVIGRCDFFIGCRMHACVGALSQGIPAVGIAYSDKFVGVFDTVGFGSAVVDARKISTEEAVELCVEKFRSRNESKSVLVERIEEAKRSVKAVIEEILADG